MHTSGVFANQDGEDGVTVRMDSGRSMEQQCMHGAVQDAHAQKAWRRRGYKHWRHGWYGSRRKAVAVWDSRNDKGAACTRQESMAHCLAVLSVLWYGEVQVRTCKGRGGSAGAPAPSAVAANRHCAFGE